MDTNSRELGLAPGTDDVCSFRKERGGWGHVLSINPNKWKTLLSLKYLSQDDLGCFFKLMVIFINVVGIFGIFFKHSELRWFDCEMSGRTWRFQSLESMAYLGMCLMRHSTNNKSKSWDYRINMVLIILFVSFLRYCWKGLRFDALCCWFKRVAHWQCKMHCWTLG